MRNGSEAGAYDAYFDGLGPKAHYHHNLASVGKNILMIPDMHSTELGEKVAFLLKWMDYSDANVGKRAMLGMYISEIVIHSFHNRPEYRGHGLTDEQEIGIIGASALRELGRIDENSRIKGGHVNKPELGAFIFWNTTDEPVIPENYRKAIATGILYSNLDPFSRSRHEVADGKPIRDLVWNIPKLDTANFRMIASVVSMIHTVVNSLDAFGDPREFVPELLEKKVFGMINRYLNFDLTEREVSLYFKVKEAILKELTNIMIASGHYLNGK